MKFVAIAHASTVKIISPESATDVVLKITTDGKTEDVPLKPTKQDDVFVYEHTLYLAEVSNEAYLE